jgi:hypothetical protein
VCWTRQVLIKKPLSLSEEYVRVNTAKQDWGITARETHVIERVSPGTGGQGKESIQSAKEHVPEGPGHQLQRYGWAA